jgi:hypothetical protein
MSQSKYIYVTLEGMPLTFTMDWPFHQSAGGSDYFVLHGNVQIEDGTGNHAAISVHMSQTVREVLKSGEESVAKGPAVNAVRKACDTKDIEFIKSTKKQPIHLNSRCYSVVKKAFTYQNPNEEQLLEWIKNTVFWRTKLGEEKSWIADPTEALYVSRTPQQLMEAAKKLESQGLIKLDGEYARATDALKNQAEIVEARMKKAVEALEAKHAYERL